MTPTPTPVPAPPPPLSDNAREALLTVLNKWLTACQRTITLDAFKPTTKAN